MGRPKPTIIHEYNRGYKTEQTVYAESITVLLYKNKPVNYRIVDLLTNKIQYPKTTSVHPANIRKLAAELNTLYRTTDYSAHTYGENNESDTSATNTTSTNNGRSI